MVFSTSGCGRMVVRKWYVPGFWPKPVPGTMQMPATEGRVRTQPRRAGSAAAILTGLLEQAEGVEDVGRLLRLRGGLHRTRRQREAREGVHGALHRLAREALHGVEGSHDHLGTLAQRLQHASLLLQPQLVRRLTRLRRPRLRRTQSSLSSSTARRPAESGAGRPLTTQSTAVCPSTEGHSMALMVL